jgi:hypothetical protein
LAPSIGLPTESASFSVTVTGPVLGGSGAILLSNTKSGGVSLVLRHPLWKTFAQSANPRRAGPHDEMTIFSRDLFM